MQRTVSYTIKISSSAGEVVGRVSVFGQIGTGVVPRWRPQKPGLVCSGEFAVCSYRRISEAIRDALANSWQLPCAGWSEQANADWQLSE